MNFQEKLKKLRTKRGLLQRQVASAIDIDPAIYSKIEKGIRQANINNVYALAKFYDIEFESLRRLWVAEKLYEILESEEDASVILRIVAENISEYTNDKDLNR